MTEAEKTQEAPDSIIQMFKELAEATGTTLQEPPPDPPSRLDWTFDTPTSAINRAYAILRRHGISTLQLRAIDVHPLQRNREKIKARKAFLSAAAPGKEEELEALYILMVWVQRLRLDISDAAEKKPWLRDMWE